MGTICKKIDFICQIICHSFTLSCHRPYRQLFKNDTDNFPQDNGNMLEGMKTILKHCCVQDPTWCEVANFTNFLNFQMKQAKNSSFSNCQEDLPGFRGFMTRFLIQMSKDFATRSVEISDESQGKGFCKPEIKDRQRSGINIFSVIE